MMGSQKSKVKSQKLIVLFLTSLVICVVLIKNLTSSFFFQKKDRINFVVYDEYPVFYSLGITDQIHYRLEFYPDFEVIVPGGYGSYRVGAVGKLVNLERNPDLLKKTFSLATTTFANDYFYKDSKDIYYGNKTNNLFPDFIKLLSYSSNLNFIDRIYIYWQLLGKKKQDFSDLTLVNRERLFKLYSGYFFQKAYRDEKNNVQILYSQSYNIANEISNIIEGNGIRVVDISEKNNKETKCKVIEDTDKFSKSAADLSKFFHCDLKKGQTETSDIIMILGELEKTWEVK